MQRCLAADLSSSSQCTASAGSYHGWINQPWKILQTLTPWTRRGCTCFILHPQPLQHNTNSLNQAGLQEAGEETGPLAEVEAWQERAKRLNGIHAQLGSPDIVRVGKVLEAAQSTYFSAFTRWEAGTS